VVCLCRHGKTSEHAYKHTHMHVYMHAQFLEKSSQQTRHASGLKIVLSLGYIRHVANKEFMAMLKIESKIYSKKEKLFL